VDRPPARAWTTRGARAVRPVQGAVRGVCAARPVRDGRRPARGPRRARVAGTRGRSRGAARQTAPVLITLTTTARPASDLGYLLHKHPDRAQAFGVAAGTAHVFYPVVTDGECTAALLLEPGPAPPGRGGGDHLDDRPYTAGSLLAVALGSVFRTAMNGRCDARPELAATAIPLVVRVPTLAASGGAGLVRRLFEPLGWAVDATPVPLDPQFPEWGDARHLDTVLTGVLPLSAALSHLYVLLPVLDGGKHYRVGPDEVDKLLRAGRAWLAGHPERTLVTERYLAHRREFVRSALEQLGEPDEGDPLEEPVAAARSEPLAVTRRARVVEVLRGAGAQRVLDLGCGGGALLRDLLADGAFTEVVGVDVSARALEVAERRLRRLPDRVRERVALRQSALTYADPSLAGYDAAALVEVVEHVDPERLPALEHAVFDVARPGTVVVTTPNAEHNVRYPGLVGMRHGDHRFEWTRAQFRDWAGGVALRRGYAVRYLPVGPDDPEVGPPTQMGVFTR
jgi:3' terminal RNA ribose 2'-O-methyltransferase Hen1